MTKLSLIGYIAAGLALLYIGICAFEELELQKTLLQAPEKPPISNIYDGKEFSSQLARKIYALDVRRHAFYPWASFLSNWQALILVSIAAGFFGGFARILHVVWFTKRKTVPPYPWMGIVVAILLGAMLLLVPKILFVSTGSYRPEVVVAACFIFGCFSESSWKILEEKFNKLINK